MQDGFGLSNLGLHEIPGISLRNLIPGECQLGWRCLKPLEMGPVLSAQLCDPPHILRATSTLYWSH